MSDDPVAVFGAALAELQDRMAATAATGALPDWLADPRLRAIRIVFEPPPIKTRIYDHILNRGVFYLSPRLAGSMAASWTALGLAPAQRPTVARLFFLHEFFHIAQHVSSEMYGLSGAMPQLFRRLDYVADATAITWDLRLARIPTDDWDQLALRCHATAIGPDAFARLDPPGDGRLSGLSIERELVWWLQYARALSFHPRAGAEAFGLLTPVHIEIKTMQPPVHNLVDHGATIEQLGGPLDLRIDFQHRQIRHVVSGAYSEQLVRALVDHVPEAAFEVFRPLFDQRPELIARRGVEPPPPAVMLADAVTPRGMDGLDGHVRRVLSGHRATRALGGHALLSPAELVAAYECRDRLAPSADDAALLLESALAGHGPGWYWLRGAPPAERCARLRAIARATHRREVQERCLQALVGCSADAELEIVRRYLQCFGRGGQAARAIEVLLDRAGSAALIGLAAASEPEVARAAKDRLIARDDAEVHAFWRDRLARGDDLDRETAIEALVRGRAPGAGPAIAAHLGDAGVSVRVAAVQAMASIGPELDMTPQLRRRLGEERQTQVAVAIVDAILRILAAAGRLDEASWLVHHADPAVRSWAAYAVGRLQLSAQAPALRALLGDADPAVRGDAVDALAALGGFEPAAALALLGDPDEMVRRSACRAIASTGPAQVDRLAEIALGDADRGVRIAAAEAVAQLVTCHRLGGEVLARLVASPERSVRYHAVAAAGSVRDPADGLRLARALLSDRDAEVVAAALSSIGQVGGEADLASVSPFCDARVTGGARRAARAALRHMVGRGSEGDRRRWLARPSLELRAAVIDVGLARRELLPLDGLIACLAEPGYTAARAAIAIGLGAGEAELATVLALCKPGEPARAWALAALTIADERLYGGMPAPEPAAEIEDLHDRTLELARSVTDSLPLRTP